MSLIITKLSQDKAITNPSLGKPGFGERNQASSKSLGVQDLPTPQSSEKTSGRNKLRRRPVARRLRPDTEVPEYPEQK